MALLLRLRTKARTDTLTNPPLLHHLFSTSSSGGGDGDEPPSDSNSPLSSYVREVRNKLKQQSPSPSTPRSSSPSSFLASSSNSRQQQTSLDEIMSNLSEFRRRTSALPPYDDPSSPPPQQKPISFQDMYNKLQERGAQSGGNAGGSEPAKPGCGGPLPFDKIRGSLRQLRMSSPLGLNASRLKPSSGSAVIGGTSPLPELVFGRELKERKEVGGGPSATVKMDFVRSYGQPELGEKLRNLRPVVKGKEWFSIGELNERLMKLREMDDMEAKARPTGAFAMELRDAITQIEGNKDDKSNKTSLQRIDMLGLLGGTPTYMLKPPKEHLVEKYFHPDNMSSAEKLKIELAKVRDEFKMSESDCGSARVQVAQLTTKIKHLSSVLHKKDVHSRKGLLAMVQRRKRLLKYLRETDWDSYCFVISKLGLRDNPDHGHKTRTGARSGAMAS